MRFSQHTNIQYNHKQRLLSDVKSVFSSARCFKPIHAKLLEMLNDRVYNSNSFKRLTHSRREYIYGYIAALDDGLYSNLDWRLRINDTWVIANPNTGDFENDPSFPGWNEWTKWSKIQQDQGYDTGGYFWKVQPKDNKLRPFSNIDMETNKKVQ